MSARAVYTVAAGLALATLVGCANEPVSRGPDSGLASCDNAGDCQDGSSCNGEELCLAGLCVAGLAPSCDDDDVCTRDGCTEGMGCVHAPSAIPSCSLAMPDAAADDAGEDASHALAPPLDPSRAPDVVCPTSAGRIYAPNAAALELYRGITCVAGDVTLDPGLSDLSALSELRRIGEDLTFTGLLETLDQLSALERVDGNLEVFGGVDSKGLRLASLRWVGGNLRVQGTLETEALSALRYVGGDLEVAEQIPPMGLAPFASLEAVGGSLTLHATFSQGLPALSSVGRDLTVLRATDVQLSSLAKLRAVGGNLRVRESLGTGPLVLTSLAHVGKQLQLFANSQLARVDLPSLARAGALEIRLNPALSRCQVDELAARLDAALEDEPLICCNQGCERCDGLSCQVPGTLRSGQSTRFVGPIYVGAQTPPASLASVETADRVELRYWGDEPLPALALVEAAQLVVRWNELLTDLTALSSLRRVGYFEIASNQGLKDLHGLEGLTHIGSLQISHNSALHDVSALNAAQGSALAELTGNATLIGNEQLAQCRARALLQSLDLLSPGTMREEGNLTCAGSCVAEECVSSEP